MKWFDDAIRKGLQGLVIMRVQGHPPAEQFDNVARIWVGSLAGTRNWNEPQDAARIAEAFKQLTLSAKRWPSISDFLDVLPMRGNAPAQTLPPAQQIEYQSPAKNKWWAGRNQEEMSYSELYSIPSWYLTANGEQRLRKLMREMHPVPENYRAEVMRRSQWENEIAKQEAQQQDWNKGKPADKEKMIARFNQMMADFVKSPERIARLEKEKESGKVAWTNADIHHEWKPCNSVAEILARVGVKV